jgi:hypothetical protein
MKRDWRQLLLPAIAIFLAGLLVRSYVAPPSVRADSGVGYPVFVEPGVSMLRAPDGSRQVLGKVVIDLRTGDVWGFPTLSQDPYPATGANTKPQISHPFLLGKYEFSDMDN